MDILLGIVSLIWVGGYISAMSIWAYYENPHGIGLHVISRSVLLFLAWPLYLAMLIYEHIKRI
jgi:hypothetical protein